MKTNIDISIRLILVLALMFIPGLACEQALELGVSVFVGGGGGGREKNESLQRTVSCWKSCQNLTYQQQAGNEFNVNKHVTSASRQESC